MLGGVLYSAKIFWDTTIYGAPLHLADVTDTLFFVVPLLLLLGLAGFGARYTERYGALGKTGLLTGLSGLAVAVIGSLGGIWIESLQLVFWLGFRFLCIGLVLMGIATIRVRALPRGWNAVPLILGLLGLGRALFAFFAATMGVTGLEAPEAQGPVGDFLSLWAGTFSSVFGVLFGLGWVWLGYILLADRTGTARRIARAE